MTPSSLFGLQDHLDDLYANRPRPCEDLAEFRLRLTRLLGLENRPPVRVDAEMIRSDDLIGYREETITLDVGEGARAPVAVLVPRGEPPFKPVIAFHGHEPGMGSILGHYPDAATARDNLARDNNYAQALAEAGYLVCAVEQRGMGQRLTDQTGDGPFPRSCRHLTFAYLMMGRTLLGERCRDAMCAITYLQSRPDVQAGVLGCTGHSGGGCTALWLAALDERVTAAVVSGYFCSFSSSILAMRHCECNYVPGILELGEMGDIAALVAPRPLCVLHGQSDPLFPASATVEQFETVQRAYSGAGRADACALMLHPGGHVYRHAESQAWLRRWL